MSTTTLLNRMFPARVSLVLLCIACAASLVLSGCQEPGREATPEEGCERRLRQIGFAITQYEQTHGRVLAAFVAGPNDTMHSWRAVVTPHLMQFPEKFEYRMDEPWDSAHNRDTLPDAYLEFSFACRAETRQSEESFPFTSYLMLVRPSKASLGSEGEAMAELPPDAVLVVESAGCGIKYFEPRDLPWEDLWVGDSPFGEGKLNSFHPRVVKAVRVDGKVIDIPKNISREALKKLLSGTVTGEHQ